MDLVQGSLEKRAAEPERWGERGRAAGDLLPLAVGLTPVPVFGSRRAVQRGQHGGPAD